MTKSAPTVFVVDDDASMRRMLSATIAAAGHHVETFDSAEAFLTGYVPRRGGCLVLDVRMPGMTGLELQEALAQRGHRIPIVFLSAFGTVDVVAHAMKTGAIYFLEKPVEPATLLERVAEALATDLRARGRQARHSVTTARLAQLTPREAVVLQLVVRGKTSKAIAAELHNSPKTIALHRARIMKKLRADCVADLVRLVISAEQEAADA